MVSLPLPPPPPRVTPTKEHFWLHHFNWPYCLDVTSAQGTELFMRAAVLNVQSPEHRNGFLVKLGLDLIPSLEKH